MSEVVEKLDCQDQVFAFLNMLRDSGKVNMFGAGPYVQEAFDFNRHQAKQYVLAWMKSYSDVH